MREWIDCERSKFGAIVSFYHDNGLVVLLSQMLLSMAGLHSLFCVMEFGNTLEISICRGHVC